MSFNKTYNLIIEDIIQSVTPEELKNRQSEYPKIRTKAYFDKLIKENKMVKNEDGSYDVNSHIELFNMQLTTLEDLPYKLNIVNGEFDCHNHNSLTSLIGGPNIVNGNFICSWNKLKNLIGSPTIVNGNFNCLYNYLTSLEGCPKIIKNSFFYKNPKYGVKFTEEDVRKVCEVGGTVYLE